MKRTTCRINGRKVSRKKFERLRATLTQTDGGYRDETTAGGETGTLGIERVP